MNKPISREFRREFERMFAACATANPHIALKDQGQCEKALDLVEAVVRGTMSRGVPACIEADDLIQECLMRLPDAIRDYRGRNGAALKTYLKGVIRRDILDVIGEERQWGFASTISLGGRDDTNQSSNFAGVTDSVQSQAEKAAQHATVDHWDSPVDWELCKQELTPEQYGAIGLCFWGRMTQKEAAKELGITRVALASRLRKAHATLRRHRASIASQGQ